MCFLQPSGAPRRGLKHRCRQREKCLWTEPSSFYILDAVTHSHKTELLRSLLWLELTHRYSFPLIKHLPAHTHHCRLCCQPSSPGVMGPGFTHRSLPPLVRYTKTASPSSEMSLITSVSNRRLGCFLWFWERYQYFWAVNLSPISRVYFSSWRCHSQHLLHLLQAKKNAIAASTAFTATDCWTPWLWTWPIMPLCLSACVPCDVWK